MLSTECDELAALELIEVSLDATLPLVALLPKPVFEALRPFATGFEDKPSSQGRKASNTGFGSSATSGSVASNETSISSSAASSSHSVESQNQYLKLYDLEKMVYLQIQ